MVAQGEEDDNRGDGSPCVHSALQKIVVSLPPSEGPLTDQVVEQETEDEPQAVLRSVRGRNVSSCVEENWHVDISHPAVGVSPVGQVDQDSHNGSDKEEIHRRVVDLSRLEHTLRTDCAPDQRCVVNDLSTGTGKALCVIAVAQLGNIANHPAQNLHTSARNHPRHWV